MTNSFIKLNFRFLPIGALIAVGLVGGFVKDGEFFKFKSKLFQRYLLDIQLWTFAYKRLLISPMKMRSL